MVFLAVVVALNDVVDVVIILDSVFVLSVFSLISLTSFSLCLCFCLCLCLCLCILSLFLEFVFVLNLYFIFVFFFSSLIYPVEI